MKKIFILMEFSFSRSEENNLYVHRKNVHERFLYGPLNDPQL